MYQALVKTSNLYAARFFDRIHRAYNYLDAHYINLGQLLSLYLLVSNFALLPSGISQTLFLLITTVSLFLLQALFYQHVNIKKYIDDLHSAEPFLKYGIIFWICITLAINIFLYYSFIITCITFCVWMLLNTVLTIIMHMVTLQYKILATKIIALLLLCVYLQLYRIQRTNQPFIFSISKMPMYIDFTYLAILILSLITQDYIKIIIGAFLFLMGFAQKSRLIKGAIHETTRNFCNPFFLSLCMHAVYLAYILHSIHII